MNHLDKYLLSKQAGFTDWMPDPTFDTTASSGIGTDIGNFFKGVGNMFIDPITGLVSGDPKKMVGSAALAGLTFVPGGRGVAGVASTAANTGRTAAQVAKSVTPFGKALAVPVGTAGKGTMAGVKSGVGFGEALKNSYKFWKPGWAKGMAHGYAGTPLRAGLFGTLAGGSGVLTGRMQGPEGAEGGGMGGFNPAALMPIGLALAAALRGGGMAGRARTADDFLSWRPTSGHQTERMGSNMLS
jgi:hypothetical protein